MTAPYPPRPLWECLAAEGVPPEHRAAASVACIRFIEAHTAELRAEAAKYRALAASSVTPQQGETE